VRRPARPVTAQYLQNAAAFYLERYPATAEGLRRVLRRRVRKAEIAEAPVMDGVEAAIEAIVQRFVAAGAIDDKEFAQTKARSLHRRGTSGRMTRHKLKLAGVDDGTLDRAMARLAARPEDALVRRWKTPDDAFGPAEAFASIVDGLANPPGGRPSGDLAPLLFGFDVGVAAGLRPGRGRVVLALVATDSDAALDAALDRTARSLNGKPGIATLTPVESWTSGAVSDRPGAGGDSSDLRVRFRVRRFDLVLEGSAE